MHRLTHVLEQILITQVGSLGYASIYTNERYTNVVKIAM